MTSKYLGRGGKPSIMETDISISTYRADQLMPAIDWCIMRQFSFRVDCQPGDSIRPDVFILTLEGVPWIANVTELAALMEKYDYNADVEPPPDWDGS